MRLNVWLPATIIVAVTQSAAAGLITENYLATINTTHPLIADFNLGDTFEWSITFDEAGRSFSIYLDGLNGRAEQGEGDDTLFTKLCLDGAAGGSECSDFSYSEFWQVATDIVAYAAPAFKFVSPGPTLSDATLGNSRSVTVSNEGLKEVGIFEDEVNLWLLSGVEPGAGYASLVDDTGDRPLLFELTFTSELVSTNRHAVRVSSPASLVLLGLGLLGLVRRET